MLLNSQAVVAALKLEPHPEGGYFRRSYASPTVGSLGPNGEQRPLASSIYYLLASDSPIGCLHVNTSDIVHYFHSGSPLRYHLISPQGNYESVLLGNDVRAGQLPQLVVPGGFLKATELEQGEYGLISEAVVPGFDYADMRFVTTEELQRRCPEQATQLSRFCRK